MIQAHGGQLIRQVIENQASQDWLTYAETLPKLYLTEHSLSDLYLLGTGGYSPLRGFMGEKEWLSVLQTMTLLDETVWPIPITLPVTSQEVAWCKVGQDMALCDQKGDPCGLLQVEEVFCVDRQVESEGIYATQDDEHPGVRLITKRSPYRVAGPIQLLSSHFLLHTPYLMDPVATRAWFNEHGWQQIVGFQTRNPIHRAHEYMQKIALEVFDGLFLQPLVGMTKQDDVPASLRLKSYEVLLQHYYPKDRVLLGIYPGAMYYAGPKEAILHAIVRQNYGCTHMIIGRDHAGVGHYYDPYAAQRIFSEIPPDGLAIKPLFFDHAFYCWACDSMATEKTCPHDAEKRLSLSGTAVRSMLKKGLRPPKEYSRTEVADVLIAGLQPE